MIMVLSDQVHVDAARESHEDLPLWCGRCHPHTRALADDLDRPEPCPTCHPRTRRTAAGFRFRPSTEAAPPANAADSGVTGRSSRRRPSASE